MGNPSRYNDGAEVNARQKPKLAAGPVRLGRRQKSVYSRIDARSPWSTAVESALSAIRCVIHKHGSTAAVVRRPGGLVQAPSGVGTIRNEHGPARAQRPLAAAATFTDGRRFRVLAIVDDYTRECLALVADTSLSGLRVVRELDAIIRWRGRPDTIVSDNVLRAE